MFCITALEVAPLQLASPKYVATTCVRPTARVGTIIVAIPFATSAVPIIVRSIIIPKRPQRQPAKNCTCPEGGMISPPACVAANLAVNVIGWPKTVLEVSEVRLREIGSRLTHRPYPADNAAGYVPSPL